MAATAVSALRNPWARCGRGRSAGQVGGTGDSASIRCIGGDALNLVCSQAPAAAAAPRGRCGRWRVSAGVLVCGGAGLRR
jgi:hypothetical protein